jgi:hypothetical protein
MAVGTRLLESLALSQFLKAHAISFRDDAVQFACATMQQISAAVRRAWMS